MAFTVVYFVKL